MKKFIFCFAALFWGLSAFAQLGVGIRLNRTVFMQYEPIFVYITIRNDTGRPLLFGKDPRLQGFLMLEITDNRGRVVKKRPDKDISIDGLVLGPGEIRSLVLPINEYYDVDRLGSYRIHAYVAHSMLKHEYRSKDDFFRVEYGAVIWKHKVGIPDLYSSGKKYSGERTYQMRRMWEGALKYYYLVVEDDHRVYGVTRVGRQIGREEFQAEVDMLSRIHLLIPISPRVFHYLAFGVDGINIANSYWKITETIPRLFRNSKTGVVVRVGGSEALEGRDFVAQNKGKKSGSQLLREEDMSNAAASAKKPKAPKSKKGPYDIGAGIDKTVHSDIVDK